MITAKEAREKANKVAANNLHGINKEQIKICEKAIKEAVDEGKHRIYIDGLMVSDSTKKYFEALDFKVDRLNFPKDYYGTEFAW